MFRILKHNHRKLVFLAGDKDFKSMLSFLKREVPDLEICLIGFSHSMANDLKEQASRNKVFYLDKHLELFYNRIHSKKEHYAKTKNYIQFLDKQNKNPALTYKKYVPKRLRQVTMLIYLAINRDR